MVCGAVRCWLAWHLRMLTGGSAGREISKEEGTNRLATSSAGYCSGVINFRLESVITSKRVSAQK